MVCSAGPVAPSSTLRAEDRPAAVEELLVRTTLEWKVLAHAEFPIRMLVFARCHVLGHAPMFVGLIVLRVLARHVAGPLRRDLVLQVARLPHQMQVLRIRQRSLPKAARFLLLTVPWRANLRFLP